MKKRYASKDGSPGNCLFIVEELEKLIEAVFLIVSTPNERISIKKSEALSISKSIPLSLTEEELANPLLVMESFFKFQSLRRWKIDLHQWMEAALSNFSVAELSS